MLTLKVLNNSRIQLILFQVIEMAEKEGLEPDLALTFFKMKGYNAIKEYHMETMNNTPDDSTDSKEPLLVTLLMECVQKHNTPIKQVIIICCWIFICHGHSSDSASTDAIK